MRFSHGRLAICVVRADIQDPAFGGNVVDHDLTRSGPGDNFLLVRRESDAPDLRFSRQAVSVWFSHTLSLTTNANTHPKLSHVTRHPATLSRLGKVEHRVFVLVFRRAQEVDVGGNGRVDHPSRRRCTSVKFACWTLCMSDNLPLVVP